VIDPLGGPRGADQSDLLGAEGDELDAGLEFPSRSARAFAISTIIAVPAPLSIAPSAMS